MILFILVFNLPLVSSADTDGDGVDDSEDVCIFVSGNATSIAGKGCPDSDGDGQADFETAVIANWGEAVQVDSKYITGGISRAVAWSPNGSTFFAGGNDGILNHWDLSDNLFQTNVEMLGDIQEIRFSDNGSWLGIVSENGDAVVINASTSQLIANLSSYYDHQIDLYSMVFSKSGDKVWIGGDDNVVSQFNTTSWTFDQNITGFPDEIRDMEISPDGSLLFVSSMNELRAYWTSNLSKAWERNSDHGFDEIDAIAVSHDGRFIATGSEDNWAFVYEFDYDNATIVHQINFGRNVREIVFSRDGGTMLVTGDNSQACGYRTDTWASLGCFGSFGSNNNNRGTRDIALDESGNRVLISQRNGRTSIYFVSDGFLRLNTDFTGDLMDYRWQDTWPSGNEVLRSYLMNEAVATKSICEGDDAVGVQTNGYSRYWATALANYSQTGLLNCKSSSSQLLEVPIGRIPGAFFVKAQGNVATCLANIGGLSLGQIRWAISASSDNTLSTAGDLPALDITSIAPNSDFDGIREWQDFHSSCPDDDILLSSRWENRSEMMALKEALFCFHCNDQESIYLSTNDRARQSVEFREEVVSAITGNSGDGILGYTELPYLVNQSGVTLIPLVDNLTHGATDAINNGQNVITPSNQSSKDGEWPVQVDLRVFINTEDSLRFKPFLKWLLTDSAVNELEEIGFVGLNIEDLVNSWARLGVNKTHLLPDSDGDGVWDGLDKCPNTTPDTVVNSEGCAIYQLDDDNDGISNLLDDCISVAGNSTIDRLGCPDLDGDGWSDDSDAFDSEPSQWNDSDMDGYGDESGGFEADDCPEQWGNSTIDRLGCLDQDGDGWSDDSDAFDDDANEWLDTDGDGVGDNSDDLPEQSTQTVDSDGDGYGENETGTAPDACPSTPGTSYANGTYGCPDSDGDTWADLIDSHPNDSTQWLDSDGDGFGDRLNGNQPDYCPQTPENETSFVDQAGCGPSERDSDYDGIEDASDNCNDTKPSERLLIGPDGCTLKSKLDTDDDGVNDLDDKCESTSSGVYVNSEGCPDFDKDGIADDDDDCSFDAGNSTHDRIGCLDSDGDGYSNFDADWPAHPDGEADAFPFAKNQWNDTDGDGFGDNWGNSSWNESREPNWPGEFIEQVDNSDRCPLEPNQNKEEGFDGCKEALVVAVEDKPEDVDSASDDSDMTTIAIGVGVLVVAVLVGVIFMILRKSGDDLDDLKDHTAFVEEPPDPVPNPIETVSNIEADNEVSKIDSWEGLPAGEYLDSDENGTVWFKASDGSHWWQNQDGSWEKWQG